MLHPLLDITQLEINKLMSSKIRNLLLSAVLCSVAVLSSAQQFFPPQEILHSGKVYKLAFKNEPLSGRAIYEYTTDAELIEKWTTLVTLIYSR